MPMLSPADNSLVERTATEDYVAYNIDTNDPNRPARPARDPSRTTLTAHLMDTITSSIIPPRNSFYFTDYSPMRFARIRQLSGVSPEDYIASFNSTTMPVFSEGRSGAFVYFSSDEQYIVKTTTPTEFERLLTMLPSYEAYLAAEKEHNRDSLLTRYLGAHRIVMYDIPLYFVVMKNICPVVDEKYDLKGSWINRHGSKRAKDPAKARPKKYYHTLTGSFRHSLGVNGGVDEKEPIPLFLDNDLKDTFLLSPTDATAIAQQLDRDTKFLRSKCFGCDHFACRVLHGC
jgi:1-phosphatidylinositol-4-phosphate 5-kinase